jgi:hypothetical protein
MNKRRITRMLLPNLAAAALLAGLAAPAVAAPPAGQKKPPASATKPAARTPSEGQAREDFYIVVSVNQPAKNLVLKLPTEVTMSIDVNDKTVYLDENGRPITFADLHAGDTVYVVHRRMAGSPAAAGDEELAVRIRKGPMTPQELHRRYLTFS